LLNSPSAPLNPINDPTVTTGYKVGLKWSAPSDNGGAAVIDYAVWTYSTVSSAWVQLATAITSLSYTAINLTPGTTYQY
jgi:hypothetical protein